MRAAEIAVAVSDAGSDGSDGAAALNGEPADHAQLVPVMVPSTVVPAELDTVVRPSSFIPHRAARPVTGPVSSEFIAATISACVRAIVHTRASSSAPFRKPAAAPVEVMAVP